ncbi:MAG TPA: complex I NDUFA9 subunit family protein [Deinococcales bacterium]|nr:complex I NDUFA9 subunit family protein [Deinococcales bacterium]
MAVTGATGFIGKAVVARLAAAGHEVVAVARRAPRWALPAGARFAAADVATGAGLREAFAGAQAVVHLVGIIREAGGQTFQKAHVDGTRHALEAAKAAGARRFLHMSALGAREDSRSGYSRSKAQAEALVRASGLEWTIFRPSLVFGPGDDFFGNVLAGLTRGPVAPIIGDGHFPFTPVWVEDVAAAFQQALTLPVAGRTFDLTGPRTYTFEELVRLVAAAQGRHPVFMHLPLPLMNLAVAAFRVLPTPPITPDQYAMLLEGNAAPGREAREAFTLVEPGLSSVLPAIVGRPAATKAAA